MGISADGDNLFVGLKDGKFYRISGLNSVVDDATGTITDSLFAVTTTQITLPMSGQCVTSVCVDPRDNNKVVVTCGNYGNDDYVFYSTNAMSDEPTFVSKQANLPKMPVYSSLIERETGDVIIGTERGIYRTDNINNPDWVADGFMMGEVPVMELKQQLLYHEDEQTVNVTEEGIFVKDYPGVHNTGVIYAATYGRGVFRCENYKEDFDAEHSLPLYRVRQTPVITADYKPFVLYQLSLECNAGAIENYGKLSQCLLQMSNDGGYTWGNVIEASLGERGQYSTRLSWLNLGRTRQCVLKVMFSEDSDFVISDANLRFNILNTPI